MPTEIVNSYMPPYPASAEARGVSLLHVLTKDSAGKYAMYSGIVTNSKDRTSAEWWVAGGGQKATRALALATFSFDEELYRD